MKKTGKVKLGVYSGAGVAKYLNVIRVDSWRDGKKISSIYRELPLSVFDCPQLPNRKPNNEPQVHINNIKQSDITLNVVAGDKISIPIKVIDNDSNGIGNELQLVSLKAYGQNFASDFQDTLACPFPPCAQLINTSPAYDSTKLEYLLEDSAEVKTNFEWQTECSHLLGKEIQVYNFNFEAQDNHCPIPRIVHGTISIRLAKGPAITAPNLNCISANNGFTQLAWSSEGVSSFNFEKWMIYRSESRNNNYVLIDSVSIFGQNDYVDSNTVDGYYFIRVKNSSCSAQKLGMASDTVSPMRSIVYYENRIFKTDVVGVDYQWYDCNARAIIPDATESSYTPIDTGHYALIISNGICVDTSECIPHFSVGIAEVSFQEQINLFPNPTSGKVKLSFNGTSQKLHILVRNIHGQLVQEQQFINQQQLEIELEGEAGIYFLQFTNEKGQSANLKVVKQ